MPQGTWSARRHLPFGIADAPAVSHKDKIFVFGGYGTTPRDVKDSVLEYSTTKDVWCLRSPMSKPRWGAAAALYGDRIYVFGGCESRRPHPFIGLIRPSSRFWQQAAIKDVERYDIAKDNWTMLSQLPHGLRSQGLMAVTVGYKIYIFYGGFTFEYDPVHDRYARRANAPLKRSWATCAHVKVATEDRIYIIGGFDSAFSNATNMNYYYMPASNKWIGPCALAPYRAYGVTRDNPVWKNRIYFGFGHKNPDLFYRDIHAYDPENDNWEGPLSKARFERDGVGCAVVDGSLYVVGGRSEPNDFSAFGLTCNEQLELPSQAKFTESS